MYVREVVGTSSSSGPYYYVSYHTYVGRYVRMYVRTPTYVDTYVCT
jgi:hypothetical protein